MNESQVIQDGQFDAASMPARALRVITQPTEFFRGMPKSGGFLDPLVYMVIIAVIDAVLIAVKSLTSLGAMAGVGTLIGTLIIMPIVVAVMSFVSAAIIFVIWMLMGSKESYETAYRCTAYIYTISPITILLGFVPYLELIGIAWGLYLLVTASVQVHRIPAARAWTVFGIIAALLALATLSMQIAARKMQENLGQYSQQLQQMQNNMENGNFQKQMNEFNKQMEELKKQRP